MDLLPRTVSFYVPIPSVLPPNVNAGTMLCRSTWSWFGSATMAVFLRALSKGVILKRLGADDGLVLGAWLCAAVTSATLQVSYHFGLGRHYEYFTFPKALSLLKWLIVTQYFAVMGPMLGRASFNVYLLGLIGKARHRLRYFLWGLLAINIGANVALMLVIFFECGTDLGAIMNPATTCYRTTVWTPFVWFVGGFNVTTGFCLAAGPVWLVSEINTTFRAKCGVAALLGLGMFAMGAAIWRVSEISRLWSREWDFTYNVVPYFMATGVELSLLIICSSLPTLGPFLRRLRQKYNDTLHSSSDDMSRQPSTDDAVIRHNLAQALGMSLPVLGNTVTIMAGPALWSQEQILPLQELEPSMIKITRQMIVNVEYVHAEANDSTDKMFRTRTKTSSDAGTR
ncbi:hypothetical protein EJ03DRAFT_93712 [Teratosphaeria nubilosa]|uniref:Rhodopsin domain-containing protein n=1 Tax=Teratosphaeria nubilosa TaxID=161662 RepID=A0A6G1L9H9_9PEZI|nr:hypothetical protein EJ03DRAFT_93712 [Teratosphaeria nubilosa]